MPDYRPGQPLPTATPARNRPTGGVRISRPTVTTTRPRLGTGQSSGGAFVPPKPKKAEEPKKGLLSKIIAIPASAGKQMSEGITSIPQFFAKGVQEGAGWVEEGFNVLTDIIDEDIYTSRFETDYRRAEDLGLEGDELWSYATQRSMPLSTVTLQSGRDTANRIAELGTGGLLKTGEPGVDYYNAFRRGDLGAMLVEDVGNIILAGRLGGAGNVVARAGEGVAAGGRPRLGGAIAATGRFIEEPIGTTVRGVSREVGASLPSTGRLAGAQGAFERIGETSRPLRQAYSEISDAFQGLRERQIEKWTNDINALDVKIREAKQAGNMETASNLQADKNKLSQKRNRAQQGTQAGATVRRIISKGKTAEERIRQTVIAQLERLEERGPAPESVETYRKRAARLRKQAAKEADPVRRQSIEARAEANENLATIKEQYPDFLSNKMPSWVFEAVIHYMARGRTLAAGEAMGKTLQELIDAATDPFVDPTLAGMGMLPTEQGIRAALEFFRYTNGQPHNLTAAEVLAMNAFIQQLTALSDLVSSNMRRGKGMPEGAAPWWWFQNYPPPQDLLAGLELVNQETQVNALNVLDVAVAKVLSDLVRQGLIDPEFFDEYNINVDEINRNGFQQGLFRSLVEAGMKEVDDGIEKPPAYMIAYTAVQTSFKDLQRVAPELMLNPQIYPAIMRPNIIAFRQLVRQTTAEDVGLLADQLANIARENADILPQNVLDAITRDIRKALDPQTRGEQSTFTRLSNRVKGISNIAEKRLKDLQTKAETLTTEEAALAARLAQTIENLTQLEDTLRNMAAEQPAPSPRLVAAQQRLADTQAEVEALQAEKAQLQAEDRAARDAEAARLQPLTERLTAEEGRLSEVNAREAALLQELAEAERLVAQLDADLNLVPRALEDPAALQDDFELVTRREAETDIDSAARQARAEAIDAAQAEVQMLLDEVLRYMGPEKLKRRGTRIDPLTNKRVDDATLAQEDVMAALWPLGPKSGRIFKAFYREFTADGPSVTTADELSSSAIDRNVISEYGEEFLTSVAKVYVRLYEARQRLREARKSTDSYRGDVLTQDLLYDAEVGELGRTGLTSQQVTRAIELQDPVVLNDLIDRRKAAVKKVDDLRRQADEIGRERTRVARDVGAAEGAMPRLAPATRSPRLSQIDARLQELVGEQRNAARRLKFAEKAEPKEAAKAQAAQERAVLQGIGRIRRPAPGAEGPALGEVQAQARNLSEQTVEQVTRQQARNVERLRRVRRNMATQEALAEQAELPGTFESQTMRKTADFGPTLYPEGEQPAYLPAGPTQKMRPGEPVNLTLRGEGAAPETQLQATKRRTTGALLLSAGAMAERIGEILGQQYRNSVIQEILADPTVTSNVRTILGEDVVARLLAESEEAVQNQGISRNTSEFQQAVQREFGNRAIAELRVLGYEPVSPVRVDPNTGARRPVGDLTLDVQPNNIDSETLVMRYGLRERIVSQYENALATEAPTFLGRTWDNLGELTRKWKSHILPLSLRWEIGDAVGIVLFAWLRGDIPPRDLYTRMKQVVEMMKDPNDPRIGSIFFRDVLQNPFADPVLAALFANGLDGRGLKAHELAFSEQMDARISGRGRLGSERSVARPYNWLREKGFRANEAINGIGRAAVALEKLDRILQEKGRSLDEITGPNSLTDPVISQAISEAVDATNQTLGAFSELTPWEKRTMRNVYPFWPWLKFINKAALELAVDNPDRVLFYAHLGSMAAEDDNMGLSDWLSGKTPMLGSLWDLSFMNPYADALIYAKNPFEEATETFTGISPALSTPLKIAGELSYGFTGRRFPLFDVVSRPTYLEGRREAGDRSPGDTLGGAAYLGIRGLVPIARNVFDILPEGTIPGTDIATGPVQRFGQGSRRTTGAYAAPRLTPTTARVSALLRTFGIPAPLISIELAQQQAKDQRQRDVEARLRRIEERQRAGG
jgi:hypothetical protein